MYEVQVRDVPEQLVLTEQRHVRVQELVQVREQVPAPVREPAMSYMSLTAALRPASGPDALPATGAARSWGTKNAPRLGSSCIGPSACCRSCRAD